MSNTKKRYTPYAIWDYELEIKELDRESQNGWQLVHGGAFHRKYEKDDSIVYRYQIDFNNKNERDYYEIFKEQGWEYVSSTFNGWNYFRKPYDPLLEESEYEIYTDTDSKKKMNMRFVNVMLILFILGIITNLHHLFTFIKTPKISNSAFLFVFGFFVFLYVKARIGVSKTIKGIVPKKRTKIEIYFLLYTLAIFIMVFGAREKSWEVGNIQTGAKENEALEQNYIFDSAFPDFYYINFSLTEGEVTGLRIENEDGKKVFENVSVKKNRKEIENENKKMNRVFLRKGKYYCIITTKGNTKFRLSIM